MVRRSSPQKGSCIWDLTAQASGQALIKGSESAAGSATRSVFPSIRRPVTLLFSTLLHLCVYLQPADLSVPSLFCLRICSVPHTIRGRCLPSLPPLKKKSLFHQVGFLLGLFCILIKILCVFAWVCGLTTYYFNSRGALAITFVRLCVLQM